MTAFTPPEIWQISKIVRQFVQKVNRNRNFEMQCQEIISQSLSARQKLEIWMRSGPTKSVDVSPSEMRQFKSIIDLMLGPNIAPGSVAKTFKFIGLLEKDGSELYELRQKLDRG